VGVNVDVGTGVFVGVELGVVVGNKIGVTVAGGVGEGEGGAVEVGIAVGVGKTIRVEPPQAMRKKAVPDKSNKKFLIIATYLALQSPGARAGNRATAGRVGSARLPYRDQGIQSKRGQRNNPF
jgi:hypothetical protein